jgi:glycosyltransferase involved in cell wall biosynthesis
MRLIYIAYPTSLTLGSANAIQTYCTLRELRQLAPNTVALVPHWPGSASRFTEVGARHLIRPAIGKLSRLYKTTLLYYAERSVFAAMTAFEVARERQRTNEPLVVYVREALLASWWSAVWGPALGLPVIYEAHDLESWNPSRAKEHWAQPLLNLVDRAALTRSSAVTSLTDDFRRLLVRISWRNHEDVTVIPDAFDQQRFYPGDRGSARQALQLPATAKLLVYAGMTFAYRGLDRLLLAFARLRRDDPSLHLALVGGRPTECEQLAQQATALGIAGAVSFTGQIPQDQVLPYLHAADLLVIPDTVTDVTASPLKLFEYLATGRAVVLPNIPALHEILPATVGYYFRRGDVNDLGTTIQTALHDPDRPHREHAGLQCVLPHTYTARAAHILHVAQQVLAGYAPLARL